MGDGDSHCMDIAGIVVYSYISDREFTLVGEESGFPGFGYIGWAAFCGVWRVGNFGGGALDFRPFGPAFCGVFYRLFNFDCRNRIGNYGASADDQSVCGVVFFGAPGVA